MSTDIFLSNLNNIFDENCIKTDSSNKEKYRNDWSTDHQSNPIAIVFPKETEQVIDVLKLCNEFKYPLIGSGGRTGLSGGASATSEELIVSFDKMNSILEFDENSNTVLCQPGLITQNLQSFADDNNLYYPVDFSSAGSSQVGGNIATNAGGIRVLKYGSTSRYVEGLEVITGDASYFCMDDMLVKNATGPNLKNLFIGSEGIFGLTVSSRMKLINKPLDTSVVLIGFDDISSLDKISNSIFEYDIEAVEFFTFNSLTKVQEAFDQVEVGHLKNNYYLIVELYDQKGFTNFLEKIYTDNLAQEIIVSTNNAQKKSIWQYRLLISESITRSRPIKLDIAVPLKNITKLIEKLELFFKDKKSYDLVLFGHIGDGNLHVNILTKSKDPKLEQKMLVENEIYTIVRDLKGTFSAEHGIGLNKVKTFMDRADKLKIETLKNLKKHFDKNGILNPGKLIEK